MVDTGPAVSQLWTRLEITCQRSDQLIDASLWLLVRSGVNSQTIYAYSILDMDRRPGAVPGQRSSTSQTMTEHLTRRRLLIGTAASAALAGCLDDDADPTEENGGDDTEPEETDDDYQQPAGDDEEDDDDSSEDSDGGEDDSDEGEDDSDEGEDDHEDAELITVSSNVFEPDLLVVEPGTTVRWELDGGSHTVTAYHEDNDRQQRVPDGTDVFDESLDDSFERAFETEGVYDYYCSPHESGGMVGTIVVGEPAEDDNGLTEPADAIPDGARTALADLNESVRDEFGLDAPEDDGSDDESDHEEGSDDDSGSDDDGGSDDGGYGY